LNMNKIKPNDNIEKELFFFNTHKSMIIPSLFTERQLSVITKKIRGERLTQTERNYLSNSIKNKMNAVLSLTGSIDLEGLYQDLFSRNTYLRSQSQNGVIHPGTNDSIEYDPKLNRILSKLLKARKLTFITGAGISKLSGLPTFRGSGGLWETKELNNILSERYFRSFPENTLLELETLKKTINSHQPNINHKVISKMEFFYDIKIITQNIDGYHTEARSSSVFELHGNINRWRMKYGKKIPDITLIGEDIKLKEWKYSRHAIMESDIIFIIGTSAHYDHIHELIQDAPGYIIEINPEKTPLSETADSIIRAEAEEILPRIYNSLLKNFLVIEFRKEPLDKNIHSVYLFGSILKERRIPNDLDIMIVVKKKPSIKDITKIKDKILAISGIKPDLLIYSKEDLIERMNNMKEEILSKGILLYGKNFMRDDLGKV